MPPVVEFMLCWNRTIVPVEIGIHQTKRFDTDVVPTADGWHRIAAEVGFDGMFVTLERETTVCRDGAITTTYGKWICANDSLQSDRIHCKGAPVLIPAWLRREVELTERQAA